MGRLSPLASVSATRETLERHGLATKKSLGQNFLINDDILVKIIALAEVRSDDAVLEVGPGIGTLTIALLKHAGAVVSVERDPDLPAVLAETCAPWADRFALIQKDALDLSPDEVSRAFASLHAGGTASGEAGGAFGPSADGSSVPNKLVANLPYAVAATVVLGFFERFASIEVATVMVQKEVADRMEARPGTKNYGAYTVKLGMHAQPAGRFAVSPGNFFPPPHVDSAVIRLDRRVPEAVERTAASLDVPSQELVEATCTMADAAFATRRKTLSNSCKTYFSGRGEAGKHVAQALPQLFEAAGIDSKRRGESLCQEEFVALGAAYLRFSRE